MTTTSRIPPTPCWFCGKHNDAASNVGNQVPDAGDLCLCFKCGEWQIFNADLTTRKPTEQEVERIAANPFAMELQAHWRKRNSQKATH